MRVLLLALLLAYSSSAYKPYWIISKDGERATVCTDYPDRLVTEHCVTFYQPNRIIR